MMFGKMENLVIPEGSVVSVACDGITLWRKSKLPIGYTELDYIEVTGSQFIDTGFVPNQDTRFVTELMMVSISGNQNIYGARQNANSADGASRNFAFRVISGKWQPCYGRNLRSTGIQADTTKWHMIDQNKNVCCIYGIDSHDEETITESTTVVDGVAVNVIDEQTFTSPHTFLIGAIRSGSTSPGTLWYTKARFRRSQLYNNGELVRDLFPCLNPDGEAGMYDTVNAVFYGNAGANEFEYVRRV